MNRWKWTNTDASDPSDPSALVGFDNADWAESKPIACNYKPLHLDVFMIYTMDAHDGGVPDLKARGVGLDYTVLA